MIVNFLWCELVAEVRPLTSSLGVKDNRVSSYFKSTGITGSRLAQAQEREHASGEDKTDSFSSAAAVSWLLAKGTAHDRDSAVWLLEDLQRFGLIVSAGRGTMDDGVVWLKLRRCQGSWKGSGRVRSIQEESQEIAAERANAWERAPVGLPVDPAASSFMDDSDAQARRYYYILLACEQAQSQRRQSS